MHFKISAIFYLWIYLPGLAVSAIHTIFMSPTPTLAYFLVDCLIYFAVASIGIFFTIRKNAIAVNGNLIIFITRNKESINISEIKECIVNKPSYKNLFVPTTVIQTKSNNLLAAPWGIKTEDLERLKVYLENRM